jgi:hypothetical protein
LSEVVPLLETHIYLETSFERASSTLDPRSRMAVAGWCSAIGSGKDVCRHILAQDLLHSLFKSTEASWQGLPSIKSPIGPVAVGLRWAFERGSQEHWSHRPKIVAS